MNNRQRTHSENNDAGAGTGRLAGWALAGALCLGANIVPMMVFLGLAIRHPGEYAFLLPVVMFFASARSVVFALQGIGSIEDPARIALASLALAASGVAIALFGEVRHPLWSVGAVLVGCGMGAYASMFRTVRDGLKREGKWTAQASTPASYLLLVIILALVAVLRRGMVEAALAAYLTLVVANLAFMRVELRGRVAGRMFAFGGRSHRAAVYAAAALVAALAVCFLRETADAAYALAVLCACTVLLLVAAFATPRPPGRRARRTFWYGACRSFLLVFSLLYCTATGQGGLLFAAYACYGLGIGVSKLVSKPIERLTGPHCEAVCMLGAFASCCLCWRSLRCRGVRACCWGACFLRWATAAPSAPTWPTSRFRSTTGTWPARRCFPPGRWWRRGLRCWRCSQRRCLRGTARFRRSSIRRAMRRMRPPSPSPCPFAWPFPQRAWQLPSRAAANTCNLRASQPLFPPMGVAQQRGEFLQHVAPGVGRAEPEFGILGFKRAVVVHHVAEYLPARGRRVHD